MQERRAGHSMLLIAAHSFILCLGLGFNLFFPRKGNFMKESGGAGESAGV